MIFCSALHLRGGSYPQDILNVAAHPDLNNDNKSDESLFFLLFNKILFYWFPPAEGYVVCPMWPIPDSSIFSIDFVIEHDQRPFLLIEIKPPSIFRSNSGRVAAIAQVMQRLDEIGPNNQYADRLYAISAIGKRWTACYALQGDGSRSGQPANLRSADPECWNPDITSDASWTALQSVVETIKGYVAQDR